MRTDRRLVSSHCRLPASFEFIRLSPLEDVVDGERTMTDRRSRLRTDRSAGGASSIEMILGVRDDWLPICVADIKLNRGRARVPFPSPRLARRQRYLLVEERTSVSERVRGFGGRSPPMD